MRTPLLRRRRRLGEDVARDRRVAVVVDRQAVRPTAVGASETDREAAPVARPLGPHLHPDVLVGVQHLLAHQAGIRAPPTAQHRCPALFRLRRPDPTDAPEVDRPLGP
jgi:hypothetical protein